MNAYLRIPLIILTASAVLAVTLTALATGCYFYVEPSVPDAEELREVRFQIPLSVYSRDGRLMAQFGEEKRTPVDFDQIPDMLVNAVLAAEDDRFFEHSGIDYAGIARGAYYFVTRPGERVPGGSTITQQITRVTNLMSRDYSLWRKFKEAILAFRIEKEFTKEEILELYLNTYPFGQRSFGVAAAARTYFDKDLDELTLSEAAIIAGIPTGPSIMNPYNSPENARNRRAYVLRRMLELGFITPAQRTAALAEPVISQRFNQETELDADYVSEMVRAELIRRLGPAAYTHGLKVTTTIDSRLQRAATRALRATLVDYDERHGYRGPVATLDVDESGIIDADGQPDVERMDAVLNEYQDVLDYDIGIVAAVADDAATVYVRNIGLASVGLDAVSWAASYVDENRKGPSPKTVADVLHTGDIVRFRRPEDGSLKLAQLPEVQGAMVSVDPQDGAIAALVGGFDYFLSNYNRATQAERQPGSSFKPFIYSAALEHGYNMASIINDAPLVEESTELERVYKPENWGDVFHGETPLREALKESMNLAAIRTLRNVGLNNTIRHLRNFGFEGDATPPNSSLALGGGNLAPVDLAKAYAVLANGGYRVTPYFIQRIEDTSGNVIYDAKDSVRVVCQSCEMPEAAEASQTRLAEDKEELITSPTELYPDLRRAKRVVSAQNVYLITDILKDVVRSGSGNMAYRELRRRDLAGKTGTTNGPTDAWFAGFNADIVAVAWVGFDDYRELGTREQGGVTAIPMWISYMREALAGRPERLLERPPGIVELRINPKTGLIASDSNRNAVWEVFRVGDVPDREPDQPFTVAPIEQSSDQSSAETPIF
jgi:penicillin-binding protein 1A